MQRHGRFEVFGTLNIQYSINHTSVLTTQVPTMCHKTEQAISVFLAPDAAPKLGCETLQPLNNWIQEELSVVPKMRGFKSF